MWNGDMASKIYETATGIVFIACCCTKLEVERVHAKVIIKI